MFVSVTLSCCFVSLRTCMCQLLVLVTAWLSQPTVWERVGGNKPQPRHPGQKTKDWRPDNLAALRSTLIFSLNQPTPNTSLPMWLHTQTHLISTISMQGWSAVWLRDVICSSDQGCAVVRTSVPLNRLWGPTPLCFVSSVCPCGGDYKHPLSNLSTPCYGPPGCGVLRQLVLT